MNSLRSGIWGYANTGSGEYATSSSEGSVAKSVRSMSHLIIQTEGLGKLYRRGVVLDEGLRHTLDRFVKSPLAALRRKKDETFWALKDVSLEVKEGEVLGLIG